MITKRMLALYESMASPTRFLTGLFLTPPQNFYNSAEVEVDGVRFGEEISIVVQNLTVGGRENSADLYTNKRFKAPIHKEVGTLNSFDLINRMAGDDPFADINFQANATTKAFMIISKIEDKIRRSIEVQASQILQTAVLDLKDENGSTLYSLDFKGKATHFPDAATEWDNASANPIADLESLADVIRKDGLQNPDQIIMGDRAFREFIDNDLVKERLDNRRIELGTIAPVAMRSDGGVYKGTVQVGNYNMDVWTYSGYYVDPQSGLSVPYISPRKVIMRASVGRLDATFGAIPRFVNPDTRVLPFLPPRLSSVSGGMDLFTNAWVTPDGEQLILSAGSRPLLIPTAIDTYGCLNSAGTP